MIERQSFLASPSITRLIVFCLNGNNLSNNNQPIIKIKIVNGNMNIIHSPKPRFKFKPSGSFKYFKAIAFGGVPIGVPRPPTFAPIGIAIANAILPLPSAGSAFKTGAKKVSIIAAVAVLLKNMENTPVTNTKPNKTNLDCLPNGANITFAKAESIPVLVAAIARTKPPKNTKSRIHLQQQEF